MTSQEVQEWNRKVWLLKLIERKLDQRFNQGYIKKNKYKKIKKLLI